MLPTGVLDRVQAHLEGHWHRVFHCWIVSADLPNGHRNREYQSVHLYRCDVPLSGYRADSGEVAALVWLPIAEGFGLFDGSRDALALPGYTYRADGEWVPFEMVVTKESFVPRLHWYYVTTLIMAERLLNGATPLAIS